MKQLLNFFCGVAIGSLMVIGIAIQNSNRYERESHQLKLDKNKSDSLYESEHWKAVMNDSAMAKDERMINHIHAVIDSATIRRK